jgi:transposase
VRLVQGQSDGARLCEVPGVWPHEEPQATAQGDRGPQRFHQQAPAYRLANDLELGVKVVTRIYQRLRGVIYHLAELEGAQSKLSGEIELDEAYFGGGRKGKRGRGAAGKSIVFGLLERDGRIYTKVVESVGAQTLMEHIRTRTRKGSVYYTDAFKSYRSLRRYGKHHTVNHRKGLVDHRTKNHINGIEGFWSYAKHILYNYRGVSRYHQRDRVPLQSS